MTRVLLIEDHRTLADSLVSSLRAEGYEARSWNGSPADLPKEVAGFDPDLVLLDIYLGDGRTGFDLLPMLRAEHRKVVVVTGEGRPEVLAAALRSGAVSVIEKTLPFSMLLERLSAVMEDGFEHSPRDVEILKAARDARKQREDRLAPYSRLTPREQEVLGALMEGKQAAEISDEAFVSLSTVRSQINSILTKLGEHSQLAAVTMAINAGWQPPRHD